MQSAAARRQVSQCSHMLYRDKDHGHWDSPRCSGHDGGVRRHRDRRTYAWAALAACGQATFDAWRDVAEIRHRCRSRARLCAGEFCVQAHGQRTVRANPLAKLPPVRGTAARGQASSRSPGGPRPPVGGSRQRGASSKVRSTAPRPQGAPAPVSCRGAKPPPPRCARVLWKGCPSERSRAGPALARSGRVGSGDFRRASRRRTSHV